MLGVRADHPHDPLSADNLAVFTDSFNAASYFHGFLTCRFLVYPTGELSTLSKSKAKLKGSAHFKMTNDQWPKSQSNPKIR
jgi:hypothetical protein